MSFKIMITETKQVKAIQRGEWRVMEEQYISAGEHELLGYQERKEYKLMENGQYMKPLRGYTPDIEVDKTVDVEVLSMVVDQLNLPMVVRALLASSE